MRCVSWIVCQAGLASVWPSEDRRLNSERWVHWTHSAESRCCCLLRIGRYSRRRRPLPAIVHELFVSIKGHFNCAWSKLIIYRNLVLGVALIGIVVLGFHGNTGRRSSGCSQLGRFSGERTGRLTRGRSVPIARFLPVTFSKFLIYSRESH